ncbi:SDR family oxidoreductase [Pollutimonas harenae]|uniref:SDR family oxidoreductase n=1 Tax=Pollutimonas harenae TaxID=657015 RepID=A0A853H4X7_9BURK|nr:SDR family oxidoreductase [Pollutimonas harenae]NYT85164.1 SDR family oxidoreductase [Pollutimonas harenae]TEA72457.1 SDR family oxidoreductase [Pollutimonas harenae]
MTSSVARNALVLASSRGLGWACAKSIAQDKHTVCLNGRDKERLDSAVRDMVAEVPEAAVTSCVADIHSQDERRKLLSTMPTVDVLVLNVGGPTAKDSARYSPDEWQAEFETVFLPLADMLDQALPAMQARGWGRVVAISSSAIKQPIPNLLGSGVFRTGLTSLLASRAREAAKYGVTINSILPGRIYTDRQKNALAREAQKNGVSVDSQLKAVEETIPMRRLGTPAEIGDVCAFLCSEKAAYITGQSLLVDGGAYRGLF